MLNAPTLEATNLVEDIILPETDASDMVNAGALTRVNRWVLTNCVIASEQHKVKGLPVVEPGELFALGLVS